MKRLSIVWTALSIACAGPAPEPRTLTVAVRADVRGIYPGVGNESFSYGVNSNVFEGLTRLDTALKPQPALAESWENPDDLTWVFHLKPNLHFSDGTPVKAADVAASILFAGRRQPAPDYFLNHDSVEALGDRDVRIRTRRPDPLLLASLAPLFVLPSRLLADDQVHPVGTGPYVLDHWTRGRELVLRANPLHWGTPPAYSRVRFLVLPQEEERIRELLRGEAQIIEQISPAGVSSLRGRTDVRIVSHEGLRVLFLTFRMNEPPFSSSLVREALDLAIDRAEIVEKALGGQGSPALQLVTPATMGFNPAIKARPVDREKAKALLQKAGFPNGFSVRLDGPNNRYSNDRQILEEVARQLGAIGITVEVNAVPKEEFFTLQEHLSSRFSLFGWACESLEAGETLGALVHTRDTSGFGSENFQFLSDPPLDQLLDQAASTGDLKRKTDLWQRAGARVAELRPVLPLVIQREVFGLSSTVSWEPPLDGGLRIADARITQVPEKRK